MNSVAEASPRQLARAAGALYLVNIVAGAFAIGFVPAMLAGPDAATTAANIQAHGLLLRAGLVAHLVVTLTYIPLAMIFYELFKVVNRRLALLDVLFILVATAVEAAGLAYQFAPLALLGGEPYSSAFPATQLHALAYLPGALASVDYSLHTVFFGFDILILAYLILRSGFLPRAIAVLLAVDGAAYLVYSFSYLLAPDFADQLVPWIQLPALLGEGSFALWLLVFGVDARRWKRESRVSVGMGSRQVG